MLDSKIIKFKSNEEFELWKSKTPNIEIVDIHFLNDTEVKGKIANFSTKIQNFIIEENIIDFTEQKDPDIYAKTNLTFTGTPNYKILKDTRFYAIKNVEYSLTSDLTLDENGNGIGEVVSLSPGSVGNTIISTITKQAVPNENILTITNSEEVTNGISFINGNIIKLESTSDFILPWEFKYTVGKINLKIFLNGVLLTLNNDYVEVGETGEISKTINTIDALETDNILTVMFDGGDFETIETITLESHVIFVTYRELENLSVAKIRDIKINISKIGIQISWEDLFGSNYETTIGSDWQLREEFKNNLSFMAFMDWRGVKVVRKEGSAPKDFTDGIIVLESTKPNEYLYTPFLDVLENLVFEKTYYYGIFPYDGWSMYNFNSSNVVSIKFDIKDLLIDDLIESSPLPLILTEPIAEQTKSGELSIRWSDEGIENWQGTKVVYKKGLKPKDENDGTVIDVREKNRYLFEGLKLQGLDIGTKYSIAIFPYTATGIVTAKIKYIEQIPIVVLEDLIVDFNDVNWRDYFSDTGVAIVINSPELKSNRCLSIKPTNLNIDRFNSIKKTEFIVKLKPIEFNRKGHITITFRIFTNSNGEFEISLKNNNKYKYVDSGYYLYSTVERFSVDIGKQELMLKLSCYDMNSEILIDKIVFER